MILPGIDGNKSSGLHASRVFATAVVVIITIFAFVVMAGAAVKQKDFGSAEEAVKDFVAAIKSDNNEELMAILGPTAKEIVSSGDPVKDKQRREKFVDEYDKKNSLATDGGKMVLVIGEKDWPFPIPLVKKGERWFFDTKAGKEEILNRRIGENELDTIQTMLAIVDAEREYAMKDRDNNALLEYAEKFRSDPGKKNGLYWETKEGEEPSPMGEFVAKAREEGYKKQASDKPIPYHGYFYRILKAQGKNAPGGAYSYLVKGKMIGGFAVVAFPSQYGSTGVMTFIVNHDGTVYQKDLGRSTKKIAEAMKEYDPGKTWKEVKNIAQ